MQKRFVPKSFFKLPPGAHHVALLEQTPLCLVLGSWHSLFTLTETLSKHLPILLLVAISLHLSNFSLKVTLYRGLPRIRTLNHILFLNPGVSYYEAVFPPIGSDHAQLFSVFISFLINYQVPSLGM